MIFGSNNQCYLCHSASDSLLHIFLQCSITKAIWFSSQWNVRNENLSVSNGSELVSWFFNPGFGPNASNQREEFILFTAVLSDKIWKARNNAFHSGTKADPVSLLCQVNEAVGEFLRILVAPTPISDSGRILPYYDESVLIPSPHRVRIWVDATFKAATLMVALVARDSRNNILLLVDISPLRR
ncbi:LOW QUALITY PROTEIN: hypothetical protein TorRG33x02_144980 [Trema orientale]|uniref:Reverse transcriptase zinc-binding domain-containing protein n=1 Tax=Trema orientale TaxID=63057 RepID=A0A2P5EVV0_TREOI|nr:LOW QUALITY PROTEIN: hypothetical protein TorRG33x02_144980 [Trema orientale]